MIKFTHIRIESLNTTDLCYQLNERLVRNDLKTQRPLFLIPIATTGKNDTWDVILEETYHVPVTQV